MRCRKDPSVESNVDASCIECRQEDAVRLEEENVYDYVLLQGFAFAVVGPGYCRLS
jgi:hypothetical protein